VPRRTLLYIMPWKINCPYKVATKLWHIYNARFSIRFNRILQILRHFRCQYVLRTLNPVSLRNKLFVFGLILYKDNTKDNTTIFVPLKIISDFAIICILNLCLFLLRKYAHIHAQTDTHRLHRHLCTGLSSTH